MLKYNDFCGDVLEKVQGVKWLVSTFNHCLLNHIPITPKISTALGHNTKIKSFHITDLNRIKQIKVMINTKKVLSSFTNIEKEMISYMHGIQTRGGLLLELEGNLVLQSNMDAMTMPDEQGRRWLGEMYLDVTPRFAADMERVLERAKKLSNLGNSEEDLLGNTMSKRQQSFIKTYIDDMEEYVLNNLDEFSQSFKQNYASDYNEVLINQFVVKDVLVLNMENQPKPISEYVANEFGSFENCYDYLKKMIVGEIYITANSKDAIKFVESRGGKVRK